MNKYIFEIGIALMTAFIIKKIVDITGVNDEFDELFIKYGDKFKVNPKHIKALSMNESYIGKYKNSDTVNGVTTKGILHIQLATARDYVPYISETELLKPENEISIASEHFKWLLDRFNNDLELAVRAYNGGVGRVTQYLAGTAPMIWIANTNEYWERFQRNINKLG
jgi:soluble lytic murein transglycosylase-like protein